MRAFFITYVKGRSLDGNYFRDTTVVAETMGEAVRCFEQGFPGHMIALIRDKGEAHLAKPLPTSNHLL